MSDGTATRTAPANEPSTMTILAIDLGKFKSVACRFDPATGEQDKMSVTSNSGLTLGRAPKNRE